MWRAKTLTTKRSHHPQPAIQQGNWRHAYQRKASPAGRAVGGGTGLEASTALGVIVSLK